MNSASRIVSVFLAFLFLFGCDQRPMGTEVDVRTAEWEVLCDFDYTRRLTGVWTGDDGSVFTGFAQGERYTGSFARYPEGAIFRLEGSDWIDLDFPFREYSSDIDIWGTGADNVYVAHGNLHRFDGAGWVEEPVPARVIAGIGEDEIYAATYDAVYQSDGAGWTHLYTFGVAAEPRAIWACEGPSVLVAKYPGIVQYHEGVWAEHALPLAVYDFVGGGPDDIYAFGVKNYYDMISAVWHFDGAEWTEAYTIEGQLVRCAWGSSMSDLYAAGDYGVVMHFDGASWSRVGPLTYKTIFDIGGAGPGDVYLVGDNQKVLRFDGQEWYSIWKDQPEDCNQIWAESPLCMAVSDDVGSVYLLEEGRWRETVLDPPARISDLWGTDRNNMLAGTSSGIYRFDGDRWSLEADSLAGEIVLSVHGTGLNDIHAVGYNTIFHYDGTGWTDETIPGEYTLNAVWAIDALNAFAVGDGGVVMRYDGSGWKLMVSGVTGDIEDVWGAAPDDVYAVGSCGMIHFDGSEWTGRVVFRSESLVGIIGWAPDDIVAFGRGIGAQLRYDGKNWYPEFTDLMSEDFTIAVDGTLLQTARDIQYGRIICEYVR